MCINGLYFNVCYDYYLYDTLLNTNDKYKIKRFSNMKCFSSIFILLVGNNVIQSNNINSQSIFTSIVTILNIWFDIFMILTKFFVNCIVSLKNDSRSYYKFIYLRCFLISYSTMTLLLIIHVELIIYNIMKVVKSKLRYIKHTHGQKKF